MGLTAYDCGRTMAVLIGEVVNTEWAVLCSSNLHLCLIDNHADATKLKVIPKNPRIPKSHALELHCESQCDSHLKHSLKLSWSKDGKPFDNNGTEDGRLVHCWMNTGLCVSCRFHIRKKQSPNIIHTTLKYKNSNVLFFKSVFRRSSSICCLFYVLLASVQYVLQSVVSPLRAGNRSQVWDAVYLHRFRSSPNQWEDWKNKKSRVLLFSLGGGLAHVQYLSEPGIWELLPPPQTPASGDPTAAIPLSAEVAVTLHSKKAVSVQSLLPVSLTQVPLTHKIPIIPSSHLVMTCCQHWNMFSLSRSSLQNPWQISKPMWSSAFYRRIFYSISYLYLEYRLHLHYF